MSAAGCSQLLPTLQTPFLSLLTHTLAALAGWAQGVPGSDRRQKHGQGEDWGNTPSGCLVCPSPRFLLVRAPGGRVAVRAVGIGSEERSCGHEGEGGGKGLNLHFTEGEPEAHGSACSPGHKELS